MASNTMPKLLGELLQEQQEPFTLQVYLLERGHMRNKVNSEAIFRRRAGNSSSSLKSSASWGLLNKKRRVISNCSKIVRAVFSKLLSSSVSGDGNSSAKEIGRNKQEKAESERFSSASSTTLFNSCSESDMEDGTNSLQKESIISATTNTFQAFKFGNSLQEKEVVTDRKLLWRCEQDNKQLGPLEEIPSSSLLDKNREYFPKTEHSVVQFGPSSQLLKAKRVLKQSKQLLFDCIKELVKNNVEKNQRRSLEFLGSEDLGKLLCKDIRKWSNLYGNETNSTQLLNFDFLASVEKWSTFEPLKREIGAEIGEAILEDISREIVLDMIELVGPHSCQAT